jgi:hypothetical protein
MTPATRNSKISELEKTLRVSVIPTGKNEERTVGCAIESLSRIDYLNNEVVVVDAGLEYQTRVHRLDLLSEGARS